MVALSGVSPATSTTWERGAGTLPLLVASPTSPLLVLMGRSVFFIANGLAFSVGALLLLPPLFDVSIPWARVPAVVALVALTAVTTYFAATFLGGLVLNATSARRTVPVHGHAVGSGAPQELASSPAMASRIFCAALASASSSVGVRGSTNRRRTVPTW